jgi:hypothetical protein
MTQLVLEKHFLFLVHTGRTENSAHYMQRRDAMRGGGELSRMCDKILNIKIM